MAKWHLLEEDGYGPTETTLVCTDVGEITVANLERYVDNYPCVSGSFLADGYKFDVLQKHSATAAYQGIIIGSWSEFCKTIPKQIPIQCRSAVDVARTMDTPCDYRRGTSENAIPRTFQISNLSEDQLKWDFKYVVADPRIIWMSFYVLLDDFWLSSKMCQEEIPTMEEAIANLKHYGLYRPYSSFNKCPEGVYDTLKQIWCDFIHRHHEESVTKLWGRKVHFERTAILPDKKRDAFVKNLRVVGSFAVHNFQYILEELKQNERVKLVREPDNQHDPNAIRVEAPFIHGEKLGYIPRADAEVFAPEIDSGIAYAAWISSVDREKQQVFIDIYRHIQFSLDDVTGIRFIQNGYMGPQFFFDLSLCRGKLVCKKRDSWGAPEEQQIELAFTHDCLEKHLACLQKCNLPGWRRVYHNYSSGESLFWELEIRRRNSSRICITGCNDYPEEWEAFMEFINGCLDLNKTKGDGKVFLNTIEPPLKHIPERRA